MKGPPTECCEYIQSPQEAQGLGSSWLEEGPKGQWVLQQVERGGWYSRAVLWNGTVCSTRGGLGPSPGGARKLPGEGEAGKGRASQEDKGSTLCKPSAWGPKPTCMVAWTDS